MRPHRSLTLALLLCFLCTQPSFPSAYNGRPKLVVVVVIDQFRADYLERYRDQFGEGGFKLFLDHGAYFTLAKPIETERGDVWSPDPRRQWIRRRSCAAHTWAAPSSYGHGRNSR